MPPTSTNWHTQSAEVIIKQLNSDPKHGLTAKEANRRLQEYGLNQLPAPEPPGILKIFLMQFINPLIYILLVAAIISIVLDEYSDAGFIGLVLLLNAVIGTIQEWKAEKSAASLQELLTVQATVRRHGKSQKMNADQLVPGDIVLLESGLHVPADLYLLQVNQLRIDESFLTGESVPVEKQTGIMPENSSLGDRKNMAFAGATIMSGRGLGIVVNTGLSTEVGRIAKSMSHVEANKPPLVIRMEKLAKQIAIIVLIAAVGLGTLVYLQGTPLEEVFFLTVALAVAGIPEGLPVTITVALSIATNRMAKRHVIVRKLTAVEGLGSCTFIASDKTGTLTVNKQTVRRVVLPDGNAYEVSGEGYNGNGEIQKAGGQPITSSEQKHLQELVKQAVLCNEARLENTSDGWKQHGDAVDIAFLALAHKAKLSPDEIRKEYTMLREIPYESEKKYAATFFEQNGEIRLAIKGALETLLAFTSQEFSLDESEAVNKAKILKQASALSQQGYRVIAVATAFMPDNLSADQLNDQAIRELHLLGLVGLIDPLRPEVKEAVHSCRKAGVEVAIVTGDHPETALAIASELEIAREKNQVVSGQQLEEAGEPDGEAFTRLVEGKKVFARVAPLQKMQLVSALHRLGHFVAVTGDGVNDVPALKQANIGVAMGSGTDLAKDTAEIIITDDNFTSIEAGIRGGRYAYDNIRKVTYLLISTGAAEMVIFVFSLMAGLPLPLTAVQLLWLNLVTNGIQDMALAFEAGEPESMQRPPRDPSEGIFNKLMIQETLLSGTVIGMTAFGFYYAALQYGHESLLEARSFLLMLMVFLENVHVFNCRSEFRSAFRVPLSNNWYIVGGVLLAQGIHILAVNIPFMQGLLGVHAVAVSEWMQLFGFSLSVLVVMELFKWWKRKPLNNRTI